MPARNRCPIIITALTLCIAASTLPAQKHISVPRSDGKKTPLMIYRAIDAGPGCAPLALISHGAGGSEIGYRYLGRGMANLGYTAVVMGHKESGLPALSGDIMRKGFMSGITALVADPAAESDRLLDVAAALKWADSQCHAPFRVLLGHSMGAETVMLEAGARNRINVPSPPAGQDRFDAYVALSPEGSGVVFPAGCLALHSQAAADHDRHARSVAQGWTEGATRTVAQSARHRFSLPVARCHRRRYAHEFRGRRP